MCFMQALWSEIRQTAEYAHVQEHTGKQPYFVHLEGEPVMRMAGLFDAWKGEDGELLYTYTIMTTDSSPRLQWCAWNHAMHPCGCSASFTNCRGAREVDMRTTGCGGACECSPVCERRELYTTL